MLVSSSIAIITSRRNSQSFKSKWKAVTCRPLHVNHLATMLPRICERAGTQSYTLTPLPHDSETILCGSWFAKQICVHSGQKCESFLRWPKLVDRRKQSSTRSNVPFPKNKMRRPIQRDSTDVRQIFTQCLHNENIQIHIKKAINSWNCLLTQVTVQAN